MMLLTKKYYELDLNKIKWNKMKENSKIIESYYNVQLKMRIGRV